MNNSQKEELLEYYKNLLILQYNEKNGTARATIETIIKEVLGALIAKQVEEGFNINTAIGYQLDVLAKYLGVQRYQTGYGNLSDDELRLLIKFAILKNYNLSSTGDIVRGLYSLFGNTITLTDNKDMTITYTVDESVSSVVLDLLQQQDLLPRPMGVGVAGVEPPQPDERTLTINCNVEGVTIIINNVETRSKRMEVGSGYTWSVSKNGFQSASGTGTLDEDTIIDISALIVQSTTPGATIEINQEELDGIFFVTGTELEYEYTVSKSGYISQTGSGTITESRTITVALGFSLTIYAPEGATVFINGIQRSYAELGENSQYTWSVQRTGYAQASGSGTLTSNTQFSVYTVSGQNATFNFNNTGYSQAFAKSGSTVSYIASYTGYISYSSTKQITQDTVITMATLTAQITPTPDTLKINNSNGSVALFEAGETFSYTIAATKSGYEDLTLTGSVSQTSVITGTMQVIYPFYESADATADSALANVVQLYSTTITAATAGNYSFTLKGGGYTDRKSATDTTQSTNITHYCGGGRGGIATCNVQLKAGAVVTIKRIGTQRDTKRYNGTWYGHEYGSCGIALFINNEVKLVAGGGGNGYLERYQSSGSGTTGYRVREGAAGSGGYNGGNGTVKGLSYTGQAGDNTTQTAGTAYGGHGGTGLQTTTKGTDAKGGDGYIANDFVVNSETDYYKVNSLSCTGGSNWNDGSSGNNRSSYAKFEHTN